MNKTPLPSVDSLDRQWYLVDAENQTLGRLALETFEQRWRQRQRTEVKEAAPAHGLCLLRVGYPQPVFPEPAWYDCQPRFQLEPTDQPPVS